jgi:cell division protein FtsQ
MNVMAGTRHGRRFLSVGGRNRRVRHRDWRGTAVRMGGVASALKTLTARTLVLAAGVLVVAVLSLVFLAAYRYMTTSSFFALEEVAIEGNSWLSHADVLEAGGIRLGRNNLDADIGEITDRLVNHPWISDVVVRRILPDKLRIMITERQASFWRVHEGRLHYADAGGGIIAPVGSRRFASLPVVDGHDAYSLEGLEKVVAMIEERRLSFGMSEIDWVRMYEPGGLQVFLKEGGLNLDVQGDWEEGLELISRVMHDLEQRGELARARAISVGGAKVWVRLES